MLLVGIVRSNEFNQHEVSEPIKNPRYQNDNGDFILSATPQGRVIYSAGAAGAFSVAAVIATNSISNFNVSFGPINWPAPRGP